MFGLFACLRRILMPRCSLPSASSYRPPFEDPSTAVDPEVVALPGLARLPPELLLQIILYLPAESAAVVALISKYYYVALKQYVLPGLSDIAAKKRFLRLLEVDLPEYIACYHCDILYQWKASAPRYECPRRFSGGTYPYHSSGPMYCPQHFPCRLTLEAVAVFLRGYERGPAYGPQLQELYHKCDAALPRHYLTPGVSRDTAARIVNGKLQLRISCSLQVSLQQSLAAQLDQLKFIGCIHSYLHLPAVVMDAIEHLSSPSKTPRYSDYINCAYCATDLRVTVLATKSDQLVAQINTWQCYGGRDIDQEDFAIREMFGYHFAREVGSEGEGRDYRITFPSRNLELLYNESLGDGGSLTNGLQQRHRCLRWWNWGYPVYMNHPRAWSYTGPD